MNYGAQEETVSFLATLDGGAEKIVATHISFVALCRRQAYKLKRAVAFPYLDFSTPALRLAMCAREVAVNRRFAPQLYLGAERIVRDATGALALGGEGALVDAVVVMRRFPDDALLDDIAQRGALTRDIIEALARRIASTHDEASADYARGGAAAMRKVLAGARDSFMAGALGAGAGAAHFARLAHEIEKRAPLLETRRAEGKARRCHGDLTLRNICILDGAPTLFDALEFDEDIATIDLLYDLAFVLMDLLRARAPAYANLALNRYLDARDETDGLSLLPLFMSLRATIRAHVEAAQQHGDLGRQYFALAQALCAEGQPALIAIGGFSGSGKSSVAAALAPRIGAAPGARILNSDRLRKRLFGVAPTARLPPSAYASEISARVYRAMFDAAARTLASGWPVIIDAVFDRPQDRAEIAELAQRLKAPFFGVWLDLNFEQRAARVDARRNDASDATRDVLEAQMRNDAGEIAWLRLDAAQDVSLLADAVVASLPDALRGA